MNVFLIRENGRILKPCIKNFLITINKFLKMVKDFLKTELVVFTFSGYLNHPGHLWLYRKNVVHVIAENISLLQTK